MAQGNDRSLHEAVRQSISRYESEYELIGEWYLGVGKKIVLRRNDRKRICRFCGLGEPNVTFRMEAHAVPEALGNQSLFSDYECDTCNSAFGSSIENDFGNWSKPMRTMVRIRGKKGVPTMRQGSSGGWRIEHTDSLLQVKSYEDNPIFEVDELNKQIHFKLKRDPYTPLAVLKTFYKIGLTVLPEEEVAHFAGAMAWIRSPHTKTPAANVPVLRSFVPGPLPNDTIAIRLHRRKRDDVVMPYMFLILMYGNEMFQVFIGSDRDKAIDGKTTSIPVYPAPYDLTDDWPYGSVQRGPLILSGTEIIRGEVFRLTMGFDGIAAGEHPMPDLKVTTGNQP